MKLSPLPEKPLVSIIVPSYNQGRFIGETIESILSQSYRPLEILVIDGASTDETIDVIKSFGECHELRWWSEPDNGVVEAVNKGFARARGSIGAIQSSDDFYMPDAIERGVDALQQNPKAGFVFGDIIKIDEDGRELSRSELASFAMSAFLSKETWIPQPSTFFRMDMAKSLGGWCEEVPYAADTDLWLRMAFRTGANKVPYVMAKRRMHGEQRDTQGDRVIRDYCRMIDSSEELRSASWRLRRAAAAGKLLHRNRYGYDEGYWKKLWRQWQALLMYPQIAKRFPASSFIPGWMLVRAGISAVMSHFRSLKGDQSV